MKTSARVNESQASGYELLSLLLCKLCLCVWWMCLPAWLFTALPNWIPDVILKSFWWVWLSKANRETFFKAPLGVLLTLACFHINGQLPLVSDSRCINWPGPRCSLLNACSPAGCYCQATHKTNEVTLFPVSAFLSPPLMFVEVGEFQPCVSICLHAALSLAYAAKHIEWMHAHEEHHPKYLEHVRSCNVFGCFMSTGSLNL